MKFPAAAAAAILAGATSPSICSAFVARSFAIRSSASLTEHRAIVTSASSSAPAPKNTENGPSDVPKSSGTPSYLELLSVENGREDDPAADAEQAELEAKRLNDERYMNLAVLLASKTPDGPDADWFPRSP
eukprot:CAMPEP_0113327284 /NCGR_PEP_ID=MMETSP0010_2-20120614/19183_1 /TAXON_ID=216773 ORGANISM="Corethron hystrix, Strain 308" /NCGR_SAMPLE_ID=MMETSP0010_2 /ASSEMBLY_ACC=CAM_ASM_000155 /LENGTH=130 /DNA_ID=CAMNT_0000188093 /DNA_START=12 /DNA_END=401 /DNA_ORIENTATION=+ /assembly_acc=CAM_ASM_000155